jgi:hypothetical protein
MEYVAYHATWCPFCLAFMEHYREILPNGKEEILDDQSNPLWLEKGLDYVPTVIEYENGSERRRLMARPGVGITREKFLEWLED